MEETKPITKKEWLKRNWAYFALGVSVVLLYGEIKDCRILRIENGELKNGLFKNYLDHEGIQYKDEIITPRQAGYLAELYSKVVERIAPDAYGDNVWEKMDHIVGGYMYEDPSKGVTIDYIVNNDLLALDEGS